MLALWGSIECILFDVEPQKGQSSPRRFTKCIQAILLRWCEEAGSQGRRWEEERNTFALSEYILQDFNYSCIDISIAGCEGSSSNRKNDWGKHFVFVSYVLEQSKVIVIDRKDISYLLELCYSRAKAKLWKKLDTRKMKIMRNHDEKKINQTDCVSSLWLSVNAVPIYDVYLYTILVPIPELL